MKRILTSFLLLVSTALFAGEKILYVTPPQPSVSSTNYPQTESTGYFIHQILYHGLTTLSEWAITTEKPTNTQNDLIYRLDTLYTLSGPIPHPTCLYTFRLYNDKNEIIFTTNTTSDLRYGMLDAVDVAVAGSARALGEDLSQYGFLQLTIPEMNAAAYELFLNKTSVLWLTNTTPVSLQYKVIADKPLVLSLRERPSLLNLYLGRTLYQTTITVPKNTTTNFTLSLTSRVTLEPIKTELFAPKKGSYVLSIRPVEDPQTPFTNVVLSSTEKITVTLPFHKTALFSLVYTPREQIVSTDTVVLSQFSLSYKPIDRIQTRPLYLSLEGAFYAPPQPPFPPFGSLGLILFYYPSMNMRVGLSVCANGIPESILQDMPFRVTRQSIMTSSLQIGFYPFHKKYQFLRFGLDMALGWQTASFTVEQKDRSSPIDLVYTTDILNTLMTGPLAEIRASIEISGLALGISVWGTQRFHMPENQNIMTWGIGLSGRIIL